MSWIKLIAVIIQVSLEIWKGERDPEAIKSRYAVKIEKKKHKALNAAESIFRITDRVINKIANKRDVKRYMKLREEFDDND